MECKARPLLSFQLTARFLTSAKLEQQQPGLQFHLQGQCFRLHPPESGRLGTCRRAAIGQRCDLEQLHERSASSSPSRLGLSR